MLINAGIAWLLLQGRKAVTHRKINYQNATLVEANDKNFARIKILKTLCTQIEAAMKMKKK